MEGYTKSCERIAIFFLILAVIFYVILYIFAKENEELRNLNTKPSPNCNCQKYAHYNRGVLWIRSFLLV